MGLSNVIDYIVGAPKGSGSGIPMNVKVSIDPDFKRTIIKAVAILSFGIGAGVATGIVISNARRRKTTRRV